MCLRPSLSAKPRVSSFHKVYPFRLSYSRSPISGIWPKYENEIGILVLFMFITEVFSNNCLQLWEDLGNWRSALKKRARHHAADRYDWDPSGDPAANQATALRLLGGHGEFLKNGIDEDVRIPPRYIRSHTHVTALSEGAHE